MDRERTWSCRSRLSGRRRRGRIFGVDADIEIPLRAAASSGTHGKAVGRAGERAGECDRDPAHLRQRGIVGRTPP